MNNEYIRWMSHKLKDNDLTKELKIMKSNNNLIEDAFYTQLEFGTGGLRGIIGAGINRINIYTVRKATFGYLATLKNNSKVAIAYDSRIKSLTFAKEAATVLANCGMKVYLFNKVSPTPLLSYAVRHLKCDGGIVITASHNPSNYNGYKVYDSKGCQINPDKAEQIYHNMQKTDIFYEINNELSFEECLERKLITYIDDDITISYVNTVCSEAFYSGQRELKVVYTPLNGSGMECVSLALEKRGFKKINFVKEQSYPDGNFTTCPYPNPEVKEALELGIRDLKETDSDILIATDPDCDRAGLTVKDGDNIRILNGNETGMLLLDYICNMRTQKGLMPKDPIVIKTIVTTELAKNICKDYGIKIIEVLTGFKYIGEQINMFEEKGEKDSFIFGFEESCGYLSGTYVRDKDAVNASVLICDMADYYKDKGISVLKRLGQLYKKYGYLLTYLGNYTYNGIDGQKKMEKIMNSLRSGKIYFKDYLKEDGNLKADVLKFDISDMGIAIVRPSGTEPKIKIYYSTQGYDMIEAENNMKKLVKYMERLIN